MNPEKKASKAKHVESQVPAGKPYWAPELNHHGDVQDLNEAEYGGLEISVYGRLFAMNSPTMPDAPTR